VLTNRPPEAQTAQVANSFKHHEVNWMKMSCKLEHGKRSN